MDALLTIGDFARATGLTPKALRRYDELGLLRPARVDPFSGYRYYAGEQVERARLVGWLRRIGMPLAEIGRVCARYETDPAGAARARSVPPPLWPFAPSGRRAPCHLRCSPPARRGGASATSVVGIRSAGAGGPPRAKP
ncbi:helix-turn-helix domain-containing protein [Streptomyces sp. SKN60]|nr:helix-turn-helix domain-containing protein [Streptomyces sp. SKN60]